MIAGCGEGEENGRGLAGPPRRDSGTAIGSDGGTGTGDSGLPCDVAMVLATYCTSCHGATPVGGAPISLASYADLTARSPAGGSFAERSVIRMQDAPPLQMPPVGAAVPAAAIATLQTWISAGMPRGTCGTPTDPFAAPPMCTSGNIWPEPAPGEDEEGSEFMRPGRACIQCHIDSGRPDLAFTIAGTVYPSAHEPDNCAGTGASGITVEIIGHDGASTNLYPNAAGNFFTYDPVAMPARAIVHYDGRMREMIHEQSSGDCNSCHTQSGTMDAPGRILLP